MPEIVECERLIQDLDTLWVGRKIMRVSQASTVPVGRFVGNMDWLAFQAKVQNYTVLKATRVAKNLVLSMSSGWLLQIHLSSTGWLRQLKAVEGVSLSDRGFRYSTAPGAVRMNILLSDGQEWDYLDARAFGKFTLLKGADPHKDKFLMDFGPDWLYEPEAAGNALHLHRGNRVVKDVLCDQRISAGLGNYLVCEVCFLAGVHPQSRWQSLLPRDIERLVSSTRRYLDAARQVKGSEQLSVYKRAGEPCIRAGLHPQCHRIAYVKDAGGQRGTYFCPTCQGEPVVGNFRKPLKTLLDPAKLFE